MGLARLKVCKLLSMPIQNMFVQLVYLFLDTRKYACLPVCHLASHCTNVRGRSSWVPRCMRGAH